MGRLPSGLAVGLVAPAAPRPPAPPPPAYKLAGSAWPHGRIPYYNATSWKKPVEQAVRAWNDSGAHLRFVPVARRHARVVITYLSPSEANAEDGKAIIGYEPGMLEHVWLM